MVVGTEVVGTEEAAYTMKFTKVSKYRQVSAFFQTQITLNLSGKFPTQITLNLGLLPVLLFRLISRLFSRFRSHSRLNLGWRRHSRQAHGILFQLMMC
jgi:hypothetical protein